MPTALPITNGTLDDPSDTLEDESEYTSEDDGDDWYDEGPWDDDDGEEAPVSILPSPSSLAGAAVQPGVPGFGPSLPPGLPPKLPPGLPPSLGPVLGPFSGTLGPAQSLNGVPPSRVMKRLLSRDHSAEGLVWMTSTQAGGSGDDRKASDSGIYMAPSGLSVDRSAQSCPDLHRSNDLHIQPTRPSVPENGELRPRNLKKSSSTPLAKRQSLTTAELDLALNYLQQKIIGSGTSGSVCFKKDDVAKLVSLVSSFADVLTHNTTEAGAERQSSEPVELDGEDNTDQAVQTSKRAAGRVKRQDLDSDDEDLFEGGDGVDVDRAVLEAWFGSDDLSDTEDLPTPSEKKAKRRQVSTLQQVPGLPQVPSPQQAPSLQLVPSQVPVPILPQGPGPQFPSLPPVSNSTKALSSPQDPNAQVPSFPQFTSSVYDDGQLVGDGTDVDVVDLFGTEPSDYQAKWGPEDVPVSTPQAVPTASLQAVSTPSLGAIPTPSLGAVPTELSAQQAPSLEQGPGLPQFWTSQYDRGSLVGDGTDNDVAALFGPEPADYQTLWGPADLSQRSAQTSSRKVRRQRLSSLPQVPSPQQVADSQLVSTTSNDAESLVGDGTDVDVVDLFGPEPSDYQSKWGPVDTVEPVTQPLATIAPVVVPAAAVGQPLAGADQTIAWKRQDDSNADDSASADAASTDDTSVDSTGADATSADSTSADVTGGDDSGDTDDASSQDDSSADASSSHASSSHASSSHAGSSHASDSGDPSHLGGSDTGEGGAGIADTDALYAVFGETEPPGYENEWETVPIQEQYQDPPNNPADAPKPSFAQAQAPVATPKLLVNPLANGAIIPTTNATAAANGTLQTLAAAAAPKPIVPTLPNVGPVVPNVPGSVLPVHMGHGPVVPPGSSMNWPGPPNLGSSPNLGRPPVPNAVPGGGRQGAGRSGGLSPNAGFGS